MLALKGISRNLEENFEIYTSLSSLPVSLSHLSLKLEETRPQWGGKGLLELSLQKAWAQGLYQIYCTGARGGPMHALTISHSQKN